MNSFDPEKFNRLLKTKSFGRILHYHPQLDSTNRLLKDLAAQGAEEGSLALADDQSAGRGRWGRTWESQPGLGLLFSILLRPPLGKQRSQLTPLLGVAALMALQPLAPEARLKWPNDIWVSGRKLSGILLEGDSTAVIAGMGLNVNQAAEDFSPELNAVSLSQIAAKALDREAILAEVLLEMENAYEQWKLSGFEAFRKIWDEKACFIGEMVRAGDLEGRVIGLNDDGSLNLETPKGCVALSSGEILALRPA